LGNVYWNYAATCFQFDDDEVVDHQIQPVFPNQRRAIPNPDRFLSIDLKTAVS